ncbi:hypothetical protein [Bradyrhizobium sp. AUGA SZCCT0283]|uniref:hypothetical protein n=1 Tax=Bradyrhizobium sp. AUGA SZCCT0283 TaxID=2807671 RepID=UPI002011016E|nr:hypothetical protein [Bradyrhizobium sp. AUGA SZCCT0283]
MTPSLGYQRLRLLQNGASMVGGGALAAMSQPADAKDSSELPAPKRALTGRDEAGKSVFKSFDVTPKVGEIDSNSGLTFYALYMTEPCPMAFISVSRRRLRSAVLRKSTRQRSDVRRLNRNPTKAQ